MKKIKYLILFTALVGIGLAVWAFAIEPSRLLVNEYNLQIRNWSPKLENFKIVAISDVHGGSNFIDEAKLRQIVELANAQNADIIVLLGDYVSQQRVDRTKLKMPMETLAENLKGLQAKYGVYAILGNHDGWYDLADVRKNLEKSSYRVLENEAVSIEKDGEKLRIVGLPDSLSWRNPEDKNKDAKEALAKLTDQDGKIIILTHNPDDIPNNLGESLPSPDTVLFLAGHTHGGQVRFPYFGAPIVPTSLGPKYAAGLIRELDIDVFVTTGVGTSILPVRFGVPPEIAVLTLNAAE
jgi:uncharacterized protein